MQRPITMMAAHFLAFLTVGQLVCFGQAPEQNGAAPRQPAPDSRATEAANAKKMDRLLELWEQKSTELTSLDVKILRIDRTRRGARLEYYDGRALFQSPNLAFIDFNTIQQDDKKKPVTRPAKQGPSGYRRHSSGSCAPESGGLAVQERHPANLHFSARQESEAEGRSRKGRCRSYSTCAPKMPAGADTRCD